MFSLTWPHPVPSQPHHQCGSRGLLTVFCVSHPKPNSKCLSTYKSPSLPSLSLKSTADQGLHCVLSNYSNLLDFSISWTPFALRVPMAQLITGLSVLSKSPQCRTTAIISIICPRGPGSTGQTVQEACSDVADKQILLVDMESRQHIFKSFF